MLPFSSISGLGLHPFLASLARLIRERRDQLPDLTLLGLAPELEEINGELDEEELFIFNEMHKCKGFRKLHLEIACLGSGLQILHCVFFPDPRFDLPIFGVDVVVGPAGISAAIVDLSPVGPVLPKDVIQSLESLAKPAFKQVRELPSWGTIFSPYVQFIRPISNDEEQCFLETVDGYLKAVISSLFRCKEDSLNSPTTMERYQVQFLYCLQQKNNDKTRNVLEKAFSAEWADRYIEGVLFECPPLFYKE